MLPDSSPLIAMLEKFRREADKMDAGVINELTRAYSALYRRLADKIELEVRRVLEAGGETVSRQWLRNRLARLEVQIADELQKYSVYLEGAIDGSTQASLTLGGRHAAELLRRFSPATVSVGFDRMSTEQINTIIAFLREGSPLRKRIAELSGYHSQRVMDSLIDAIALGYNPYKTAKNMAPLLANVLETARSGLGSAFSDALRMARTAQLYTYREANRATYQANSDIVTGWQWVASLDDTTCGSCLAMHGSTHTLQEQLDDHHNGRCYSIPVIMGNTLIPENSGQEWFDKQNEQTQNDILGPGKAQAYRDGLFEFGQLSKQVENDVYGTMRVVPALKDLIPSE